MYVLYNVTYEIVYTFQDYPSYTHVYDRDGWNVLNKSFDALSRIFVSEYLDDIHPGNRIDWEQFMFYEDEENIPTNMHLSDLCRKSPSKHIHVAIKSPIETIGYPSIYVDPYEGQDGKDEHNKKEFYFWANVMEDQCPITNPYDTLTILLIGLNKGENVSKTISIRCENDISHLALTHTCKKRISFLLSHFYV